VSGYIPCSSHGRADCEVARSFDRVCLGSQHERRPTRQPLKIAVYEQVAEALRGKVNVAAVDCEEHKSFCRAEGVMGYPTIRLYVPPLRGVGRALTSRLKQDKRIDYTGARSADAMRDFTLKSMERWVHGC
jgi:hypothetical protein